jgi:hypothetical protein
MNELQLAHRIRQLLNHGTRLERPVAERLRAARELALERRRAGSVAGAALAGGLGFAGLSLRVIVSLVTLGVAIAATYSWEQKQRATEVEELDALVLASDLPIDAYLDHGFAAWLKRRASQ